MLPKCAYTRMWKAFAGLFLIAGILALLKCGTYPNGPEIKIAGESIWLRYNFDRLILNIVWVIGFFALYAFSHRRLGYFKSRPQADTVPRQPTSTDDKYKLTDLDLS